ncbi:hypothetical protein H0X32_04095 [Patescibacteria group bacterium]|nr:hypothetical protein [Patescibacteria group bacterium]
MKIRENVGFSKPTWSEWWNSLTKIQQVLFLGAVGVGAWIISSAFLYAVYSNVGVGLTPF